jgi:hypothetical protein
MGKIQKVNLQACNVPDGTSGPTPYTIKKITAKGVRA